MLLKLHLTCSFDKYDCISFIAISGLVWITTMIEVQELEERSLMSYHHGFILLSLFHTIPSNCIWSQRNTSNLTTAVVVCILSHNRLLHRDWLVAIMFVCHVRLLIVWHEMNIAQRYCIVRNVTEGKSEYTSRTYLLLATTQLFCLFGFISFVFTIV